MSLLIDQVPDESGIRPADVRAYLMSSGWDLIQDDPLSASELWEVDSASTLREQVVLPKDTSYVDFRRRFNDALRRICEVYDWTIERLVISIRQNRSDILLIRADQLTRFDSIPLTQADNLVQGAVQMLQSAAWSTVSPRSSLKGRKPDAVKQYLSDDLRMGHTQRGSFVITILSQVDEDAVQVDEAETTVDPEPATSKHVDGQTTNAPPPDEHSTPTPTEDIERNPTVSAVGSEESSSALVASADAGPFRMRNDPESFILPPFQRRVMTTLASGLHETSSLTQGSIANVDIPRAVSRGVSAQLCDSLRKMTDYSGLRQLELSFDWAPLPQFRAPSTDRVAISRDNMSELPALFEKFKERDEPEIRRATLVGRVTRLEQAEPSSDPNVPDSANDLATVVGIVGRRTRRQARIDLDPSIRDVFVSAFAARQTIAVTGELHRDGRGYRLTGRISVSLVDL